MQRLMLGLVGGPLRAEMAKEAISFSKGVSRSQPSGSHDNRTRRRLSLFDSRSSAIAAMVGATERVIVRLGALVAGVADASEHLRVTFSINLHVSFVFRCLGFAFPSPFGLGRFLPLR